MLAGMALLCALCVPFFIDTRDDNAPDARRGTLSYANWGPLDRPVSLEGEWRLVWQSGPVPGAEAFVPVPREWKGIKAGGVTLPELGAASYHLTIRDLAPGRYTLFVPRFLGASRVVLNGRVVSERGRYGVTAATSSAVDRSQDVSFDADGTDVDLRIDLSSFQHRDNGLGEAPVLGLAEPRVRWSMVAEGVENREIRFPSTGYWTRAALSVPVVTRDGRKLGVMQAFNRLDGGVFEEADLARMSAFAAQASA